MPHWAKIAFWNSLHNNGTAPLWSHEEGIQPNSNSSLVWKVRTTDQGKTLRRFPRKMAKTRRRPPIYQTNLLRRQQGEKLTKIRIQYVMCKRMNFFQTQPNQRQVSICPGHSCFETKIMVGVSFTYPTTSDLDQAMQHEKRWSPDSACKERWPQSNNPIACRR